MNSCLRRRTALSFLASAAVAALLPTKLRAEPITIGAAVSAAVTIAGAIQKAKNTSQLNAALSEISGKLDALIIGQRQIIDEIYRLRLFISDELFTRFRTGNEYELRSLKDRFDFLFAGPFNSRTRAEFNRLASDIQDRTNTLGQYDFGAFVSFLTGVSMALAIRKRLGTPDAQMKVLNKSFRAKLEGWLDANNDRGVTVALMRATSEVAHARAAMDQFPKSIVIDRKRTGSRFRDCLRTTTLNLSGGSDSPFTSSTTVEEGGCIFDDGPGHAGGGRGIANKFQADTVPLIEKNVLTSEAVVDYQGIPSTGNEGGAHPHVNDANRLRNDWIAKQRRERELAFIRANIERAVLAL